ncbi:DNA-binding protein [Enterococcus villorum]|jgi:transcriptional regulator of NAD metabolism|uniref:DNA-binding protein n=1 Tax=Enterococcus villorum TaxID=112904 RepID=A0A1V8Y8G6_9ENTE|nr:transcription repressor NadR [Enterococcus villorum]OQO68913.1 DNA-binding protein [Enterococcus villorum]
MIDGELRRKEILHTLANEEKPVSASKFASRFDVSRQIIVGDVALLRASGAAIIATARGYVLETNETQTGLISKIAVQHGKEKTEEELRLIIENGGEILDVIVEHPLYGELTGMLHIKTEQDIHSFMKRYKKSNASLLSELTGGIHLHTIRYENQTILKNIKQQLAIAGILYEG